MRVVHSFLAVAFVLVLAASVHAGGDKGKKNQPVTGRVTAVDLDKGTFTVKVQPKTKKGDTQTAPAVEETFKVNEATKYNSVGGKKGTLQVTTAKSADVKV